MSSVERPPGLVRWTLGLENARALDVPVRALEPAVRALFGTGTRGSVLRGEWLGHAVHPVLTDVVIGTWTSASVLDVIGGRDSAVAAQRLIGTGLMAAAPTAWTGWAGSPSTPTPGWTRPCTPPTAARSRSSCAGPAASAPSRSPASPSWRTTGSSSACSRRC